MDVNKVFLNTAEIASQGLKKISTKATAPIIGQIEGSEKLLNGLDAIASCAKTSVVQSRKNPFIPEFIYHITSKENLENILNEGVLKKSTWENINDNGFKGIYFIDKDNFIQKWVGRKEPELFFRF